MHKDHPSAGVVGRGQGKTQVTKGCKQPRSLSHMAALTLIHGEGEELVPEHLVHEPVWPGERQ